MNRGFILIIALLMSALVGMGALYQFYVKAIIEDLQQKKVVREQIEQKLAKLETTFYKTKPEVLIKRWRQETQPWADAIIQRTNFFVSGDRPEPIRVPEGKIPKFFYADEFPKLENRLLDYVDEKRCEIPSGLTFGAPSPASLTGANPSVKEVEIWMNDFENGASILRFVVDTGASSIYELQIWPIETLLRGSTGRIDHLRIGFKMTLTYEDLVSFLERMRTSDHYFSVEVLMLTNSRLRDRDVELTVEMIVTQTRFIENIATLAAGSRRSERARSAKSPEAQARFKSLFGDRGSAPANKEDSWWYQFRRKWLPF